MDCRFVFQFVWLPSILFTCEYELVVVIWGQIRSLCCRALWQAYMQSGGSDPAIVAQMVDLQAEAQSLEKNQPATAGEAKMKSKHRSDDEQKICSACHCIIISQHSCAQWNVYKVYSAWFSHSGNSFPPLSPWSLDSGPTFLFMWSVIACWMQSAPPPIGVSRDNKNYSKSWYTLQTWG